MNARPESNYSAVRGKQNILGRVTRVLFPGIKKDVRTEESFSESQNIVEQLENAAKEWLKANRDFNLAYEEEIIDYYTYIIKACQVKYEYYLKEAKKRGLKMSNNYMHKNIY